MSGTIAGFWPKTPWTLIRDARAAGDLEARAAVGRLIELYYVPVRGFFASVLRLPQPTAEDLAHDLFARLLERDFLDGLRTETSLRGFMKLACRRHLANWRASERALRRALPRDEALPDETAYPAALDDVIDDELRRYYLAEAHGRVIRALRQRGKTEMLAIFEARTRLDGSRPEEHAALAARFGLRVYDVQNRLALARRMFGRALLRIAGERADDPRAELRELGLHRFVTSTGPGETGRRRS